MATEYDVQASVPTASLTGLLKGTGSSTVGTVTAPTGAVVGTTDTQALTHKDLTDATNTFPTLNQNTTGTAAGITGKTTPTGALVGTTDTQTLTNKTLTSPTLTTPALGTPASGTLTNCTGLPVAGGGTGAATLTGLVVGNGTSAMTAVTAPSGTVVGTSDSQTLTNKTLTAPTMTAPVLGTPASGTLTNCTGLPVAGGGTGATTLTGLVKGNGTSAMTAATAGTDYVDPAWLNGTFIPSDYGWISWAYDPYFAYTSFIPGAGYAYFTLLPIRKACTITNVILDVAVAGNTLTSGRCFAGLFTSSGSSGTLLSATADQHTNWQSTGLKTMALTTPQAVSPGLYYVGYFWNGTTGPSLTYDGAATANNGANSITSGGRFPYDATDPGLTTAFVSPATFTANAFAAWAAVS
jgi:hypothetical protein